MPEALFTISAVGYFEYLSIPVIKYCSMPFSFKIGPPNSICISSFGSLHFGRVAHLRCEITDLRFLTISEQALHSLIFARISLCLYGHQMFCARDNMAKLPGCVERMSSNTASLIAFGKAIRSSKHTHSHVWHSSPANMKTDRDLSLAICLDHSEGHNPSPPWGLHLCLSRCSETSC